MMRISGWALVLLLLVKCGSTDPPPTYEEQLATDLAIIDEYLAANGITALTHESGLRYVITTPGTGPNPTKDNCVTVNYVGMFLEGGEPFDSGTLSTPIKNANMLLGWQIGLKFFPQGSTGTLYIPSVLAYGTRGTTGIPANANLKFDIELVNVYNYNATGGYCYK